RVRDAAFEATATATSVRLEGSSRYHKVAHSRAAKAAAKTGSVIGVDARYSMLGLIAKSAAAVNPAAGPQHLRAAANRKVPAATKHAHTGITPAQPLFQAESICTNGSINKCGSGSHTVPNCSPLGVRESRMRRA